mmetsp:Transcript_295/g.983  ORF Transcript_295/g.983 Transcript_295/m.983 type:complete len:223 (+) Transcript_295:411-1079(+)
MPSGFACLLFALATLERVVPSNCCEDGECPPPPDIVLDLPPPPDVLPMPPPPDVLLLAPPPAASCEGLCGPNGSPDGVCFCDALCLVLSDCCEDATAACSLDTPSPPAPPPSCEGFCFPLGTPNNGGCFCDALCTVFSDCCDDASTACGLPVPNCPTQGTGDGNADDDINVLDVVLGVNFVTGKELNTPLTEECFFVSMDVNTDGDVNVLDLVAIINVIIGI